MSWFTIYFIGFLITFIWASNAKEMQGSNKYTASFVAAVIWPIAVILRLLLHKG